MSKNRKSMTDNCMIFYGSDPTKYVWGKIPSQSIYFTC